jgi:tetratricopeptide (TPR) repeat protein
MPGKKVISPLIPQNAYLCPMTRLSMQHQGTHARKKLCTFAAYLNKTKYMRKCKASLWFLWGLTSFMVSLQAQSGAAAFKEGEQYRKNKQYDLALQKYEEAIRIEPTKYQYYVRKGDVLVQMKRPNEAIEAYRKALELNPGADVVYARLARVYINQKNYPAAIDILNQAYTKVQDVNARLKYKLLAIRLMNVQGQSSQALSELSALKAAIPQAANDPRCFTQKGNPVSIR